MASIQPSDAALKELAKAFEDFRYIALDASATAYALSQSAPITEITTNGGERAAATISYDSGTGIVTMSKRFVFSGTAPVKGIVPMNNDTPGLGIALCRYIPGSGVLPDQFEAGGSLLVTLECALGRPV
ncbi:MAG TPA: hypothetical protein VN372_03700 [Methanospirillum sp.]|nr:hypothetical protein [Methanospirillum sp.]